MSFRKEKKFRVTIAESLSFKNHLLSQGMTPIHKKRKINSVYFDNYYFQMFNDSEEGVLPRKKVRLRWYNNEKNFSLETKISSVEGRFKTVCAQEHIKTENDIDTEKYTDLQYGVIKPVLSLSYERSYYNYKSMRITFDENIQYKSNKLNTKRVYKDPERVIEVKVSVLVPDDYIEKYIPYATSRFSKYSRGLLLSYGELSEI